MLRDVSVALEMCVVARRTGMKSTGKTWSPGSRGPGDVKRPERHSKEGQTLYLEGLVDTPTVGGPARTPGGL